MLMKTLLIWIALAATACSSGSSGSSRPPARPRGFVSSAELGDKWPLTVTEGVLECKRLPVKVGTVTPMAVTFKTMDGQVYAVNGTAKGRGMPAIDPIWKTNTLPMDVKPVARLSEQERKTIFAE